MSRVAIATRESGKEKTFHALIIDADMENLNMNAICIKVHESVNAREKATDKAADRTRGRTQRTRSWTVCGIRYLSLYQQEMATVSLMPPTAERSISATVASWHGVAPIRSYIWNIEPVM